MKDSPISALIFVTLLAGVAMAAEVQPLETTAPAVARLSNQTASTWLTDLPTAMVRAKAESKSILLIFHGSDWCPPCVEI